MLILCCINVCHILFQSERQTNIQSIDEKKKIHLPFGIPHSDEDSSSVSLLYNEDYVTAFNLKYKIPLWSTFTLKEQVMYTVAYVIMFLMLLLLEVVKFLQLLNFILLKRMFLTKLKE